MASLPNSTPVPVSGTVAITGSEIVMGTVAVSSLPGVAGTVVVSAVGGTVTTTGGLTDTQLRASAVPVSVGGTVTTAGPLTDTQLRASRVPVDGSGVTQPISVAGTVAVSGPLTDAQLRATAVPVSGNIGGTVSVAGTVPVSGPLTDTQLRASAVPVSNTSLTDGSARVGGTVTTAVASATIAAMTDGTQRVGGTVSTLEQGGTVSVSSVSGTVTVGSVLVLGDSARKTSTSVGTAVALASNTAAKFARVTALLTNTQQINVGGASALAVVGSTAGDPLLAGDSCTFVVTNLNQVFVDVRVSGEGVSYTYWT